MAKFVGKIFQASNSKLGIRGNGSHFVHVTWYNPKTKKFRCKIVTSLEDKKVFKDGESKEGLSSQVFQHTNGTFYIFKKGKYNDVRHGNLIPIPVEKLEGFEVWSAYSEIKNLDKSTLEKMKSCPNMKIKK